MIVKSEDPMIPKCLKVLMYGAPGIYKTSLAFTAESPICFDTDDGAWRSDNRQDTVQVTKYEDILEYITGAKRGEIAPYKTVILDTVGTLLEKLTHYIADNECSVFAAKSPNTYYNRKSETLTLKGWGVLKSQFASLLKSLQIMGKDIIVIGHEKNDGEGDAKYFIAECPGGSKDLLQQSFHVIGYGSMVGHDERILDFRPGGNHWGKDPVGLGVRKIPRPNPETGEHMDTMARIIQEIKEGIARKHEVHSGVVKEVEEMKALIADIFGPPQFDDMLKRIVDMKASTGVKTQLKTQLWAQAKESGVLFNKATGLFELEPDEPEDKEATTTAATTDKATAKKK